MSRRRTPKAAARKEAPTGAGAAVVPHQVVRGYVETGAWDDPTDTGRIGTTNVRLIYGFRRADPLVTLHRRNPRELTEQHLRAAERLRDDHEIGEGVHGRGKGGGGTVGPADAQLDALKRFRDAKAAIGALQDILLPVVLAGWTVKRWVESHPLLDEVGAPVLDHQGRPRFTTTEGKAHGRLISALDLLRDFYDPPVAKRA